MAEEIAKILSAVISGISMAALFWAIVAVVDYAARSHGKK